ncbi:hypothetical protein Micbo1qcDRAFT_196598, partial [Microdochium bolleyi]
GFVASHRVRRNATHCRPSAHRRATRLARGGVRALPDVSGSTQAPPAAPASTPSAPPAAKAPAIQRIDRGHPLRVGSLVLPFLLLIAYSTLHEPRANLERLSRHAPQSLISKSATTQVPGTIDSARAVSSPAGLTGGKLVRARITTTQRYEIRVPKLLKTTANP